ncbi:MAG: hypothetical protein DRP09_18775 [Candidatus Thorarchaeota archaeon]|nr:MAG: hypothetical protein DRP09_18775 [Candidatus Thorarchaeota archaeon]
MSKLGEAILGEMALGVISAIEEYSASKNLSCSMFIGKWKWQLCTPYMAYEDVSYKVVFYGKRSGTTAIPIKVVVEFFDENYQKIGEHQFVDCNLTSSDWQRFERIFYGYGYNAKFFRVKLYDEVNDSHEVWIDNLICLRKENFWEAESLPSGTGVWADDESASSGRCRKATSTDSSGHIVYGPYVNVRPGSYMAKYRLKVAATASDQNICTIDVYSNTKGDVLASRTLKCKDFENANQWQTFSVNVRFDNEYQDVELRVYFYSGVTDLYVDYVSLEETEYWNAPSNVKNQDAPTGVTAEPSGGTVVKGGTALAYWETATCYEDQWTTVSPVVPISDDVEMVVWNIQLINMEGSSTLTGFVSVKDRTTGKRYPSDNYEECVAVQIPPEQITGVVITVPENVKGHGFDIDVYADGWSGQSSGVVGVIYCFYGHAPHEHQVDDPEHTHGIDDDQHVHW